MAVTPAEVAADHAGLLFGRGRVSGPNSSRLTMTVVSPGPGRRWGVGDRRQLEHPVLLGLVVRVGRGLRRSAPVERTRPPGPAAGPVLGLSLIHISEPTRPY